MLPTEAGLTGPFFSIMTLLSQATDVNTARG